MANLKSPVKADISGLNGRQSALGSLLRKRSSRLLLAGVIVGIIVGVAVAVSFLDIATSVTISTTGPLLLYSDPSCTNSITSFSFGTLVRGAQASAPLWYLKNTGPARVDRYNWTSTIGSATSGKITDRWFTNVASIEAGACQVADGIYGARYQITVASDAPPQSYSWTLSISPA